MAKDNKDDGSYTVYKREKTGKWYAEFSKDGKKIKTVTLKATKRKQATLEAEELKKSGVGLSSELVPQYCMDFWTENSEYVRTRAMKKRVAGKPILK